jgi:hypothetical protein
MDEDETRFIVVEWSNLRRLPARVAQVLQKIFGERLPEGARPH